MFKFGTLKIDCKSLVQSEFFSVVTLLHCESVAQVFREQQWVLYLRFSHDSWENLTLQYPILLSETMLGQSFDLKFHAREMDSKYWAVRFSLYCCTALLRFVVRESNKTILKLLE